VVVVTHDPELAERAQRRIHLLDGRMIDIEAHEQPAPLYEPARAALAAEA
jgi:ABC-type lipoprotein export system ATPase subunit